MCETSNTAKMHRDGRSDQSGQVGHRPRREASSGAVPSDDDDPLPLEFLLKKKLEWSQGNVVDGNGRTTYFRRSYIVPLLLVLVCLLVYIAPFEQTATNDKHNVRRYVGIFVMMFLASAAPFAPAGPFKWPHPVFWRLLTCVAVVYQMGLAFLLFQTANDSRQVLKYLDESLGEPLTRKSYGENCTFWDAEHPERVMQKLWAECDIYWASHLLGFYLNALALRDYWLTHVMSVMFELIEYSLEHQIPVFEECWWDHWILDAALCNGLGIWCGMKTLEYLDMRLYNWRGLWKVPVYSSKRETRAGQSRPHDWSRTRRFKRCLVVLLYIASLLIMELNAFYLKSVLWIPISHSLQLARLVLYLIGGAAVSRQVYQYLDDPNCKSLGPWTLMAFLLVITELAIIVRFGRDLLLIPFPDHILISWIAGFLALTSWLVWRFFIR
ncbi:phosphatidylserine synthase 2-like [Branchiostoma lanceolatum]|uniref:phosphatidylserine synthase 2-like n=1 Tax=Branchiostoma lanceolatum TaxID=7740 RepID=UPI0034537450